MTIYSVFLSFNTEIFISKNVQTEYGLSYINDLYMTNLIDSKYLNIQPTQNKSGVSINMY